MFNWFNRKKENKNADNYVASIDNLVDERARRIASVVGLNADAIYPLCTQLNWEVSAHDKHLIKSVPSNEKEQILSDYKLLIAAAAVMSYELSQRESISFPKPTSSQTRNVPRKILSKLKEYSWQAGRLGAPEHYELMGKIYEQNLKDLESTIATGKVEIDINSTYEKIIQ